MTASKHNYVPQEAKTTLRMSSVKPQEKTPPLRYCVERAVGHYLHTLKDQGVTDLYDTVLHEIEEPLFKAALLHAGSQSAAAKLLGISRGTLRKKLAQYGLLDA